MRKILLILLGAIVSTSCTKDEMRVEAYKIETGYGYRITEHGKTMIQQGSIPSVPGNKKFCDSLDALRVGNEVIKLLRTGKIPAITADDLRRLNIKLKC
jgi:Domain of unknown function (DUF4907)